MLRCGRSPLYVATPISECLLEAKQISRMFLVYFFSFLSFPKLCGRPINNHSVTKLRYAPRYRDRMCEIAHPFDVYRLSAFSNQ